MKFKATNWIISLILIVTAITSQARDIEQVKVFIDDKTMLESLQAMSLDIVERGDNYIVIITNSNELNEIQQEGFRTEVIHKDVVEFYKSRIIGKKTVDGAMGGYKTLSEISAAVDTMITDHPSIISNKVIIGQSLEGRDIWAVKISDNVKQEENEPAILFNGAIHSDELAGVEICMNVLYVYF